MIINEGDDKKMKIPNSFDPPLGITEKERADAINSYKRGYNITAIVYGLVEQRRLSLWNYFAVEVSELIDEFRKEGDSKCQK